MKTRRASSKGGSKGFTLIEILAAAVAAALILAAVYGIFQRAIKSRDNATDRIAQSRLRTRAAELIRNDLQNGLISGGLLAGALEGSVENQKSKFPGYLRLTTTTGRNRSGETYGDVQQVEYYLVANDTDNTGTLMRVLTRDLLASVQEISREETLLSNVESFEVEFYDGQDWQESWAASGTSVTLPQAVRVRVKQAAASDALPEPLPLEICMPWTTQPWTATSGTTTGTAS